MATFQRTLVLRTHEHDEVIDITADVERTLAESKVEAGQCTVFTPHATAAITINENDDPNIGKDLTTALDRMVPLRAGWLHDRIDGNAAAHIKSAIVGPSETIPIAAGRLCLGCYRSDSKR